MYLYTLKQDKKRQKAGQFIPVESSSQNKSPPDALMFLSETCPHCPQVLLNLTDLLKAGDLASLKILNISHHSRQARELNIRSLPWVKIGPFEIEGLSRAHEYAKWARAVNTIEGLCDYLKLLLETGQLKKAEYVIESEDEGFDALLTLVADVEANITVRTGASALLEALEGSQKLEQAISEIAGMLKSDKANIRADACYFLGLTHNPIAISMLQPMLRDGNKHVHELASESIEKLSSFL